jgi:hypothetical protein
VKEPFAEISIVCSDGMRATLEQMETAQSSAQWL